MATNLASSCAAVILFTAGNPSPNCARYDDKANTFLFDLRTSRTQAPGDRTITVRVTVGGTVVNTASTTVRIRTVGPGRRHQAGLGSDAYRFLNRLRTRP